MDRNTLLMILGAALLIAVVYFYSTKDHYDGNLAMEPIPTDLDTVYIQGEPDYHAIDIASGDEMIPTGDISLGEGFGTGAGTFGFGRSGTTFIV